jgi:hypothetical protein
MTELQNTIHNFYGWLQNGEAQKLLSLFKGQPFLDTVLDGVVKGREAVINYLREQHSWLSENVEYIEPVGLTVGAERLVSEIVLYLKRDSKIVDLPVVVVADLADESVTAIRIYHSTWPVNGGHIVRTPTITVREDLSLPAPVATYLKALETSNREALFGLLEETTTVREPSGNRFKHVGIAPLREFYAAPLSAGTVPLRPCLVTFDGTRCALEYIWDQLGELKFTPQPGLAVFELSYHPGKIAAVRVYDDIVPPIEH